MKMAPQASGNKRTNLLIGVSIGALLVATPAFAQPANQPPTPPADQTPTTTEQQQARQAIPTTVAPTPPANGNTAVTDQNQIVVTGTRIRQPEFTSVDPVTSIDPEIARQEGKLDTAETLQSSPIAAGSAQVTAAISANLVTNGGPGAQTIDLRGLGANRTLVLLNGRRAGPAGTRGGVSSFDLNVLPQSIIKRVDILKTGASSIYGSDAVAGVVNIITKTDTKGLELDANVSEPFGVSGDQYQISATWGKTFSRGHVLLAADYYRQNELQRGDLPYLGCPEAYIFTDETHKTRADLIDPRTGKYHCEDLRWGHVWTYESSGQLYTTTGRYTGNPTLLQYQYPGENLDLPPIDPSLGFSAPPGWYPTGYDAASLAVQNAYHPFVNEQSIIPPISRYTLYGDASYEVTDHIEAYGEFLANRRKTYQNGWRQIWTYGYGEDVYPDNPWGQGWHGYNLLSPLTITNHFDAAQKVDYVRGVGGLRGDLGGLFKGWSYDAYVQYSHNKGLYKNEQMLQDVYDASYSQTSSCVGKTLPFSGKQCMDLPWTDPNFLRGAMTPEQIDYMFDWETGKTIYKQLSGEASVSGHLFDMPTHAGPVGLALGVTARRDSIVDTPGPITYSPNPYYDPTIPLTDPQCTKHYYAYPYYPCEQFHSNAWGVSSGGITAGHSITKEAFGEIQVPILKDLPFFKDLSFSGAARITDVKSVQRDTGITDSNKGNWTYKLGGNWAVTNWLRFRGTYGTSFRAPALFEQFKANETGFVTTSRIDPCVQVDARVAAGSISQVVHDRCITELTALGISNPGAYPGGTVTATVHSQGGIGVLNPETSTAKTASVILTPTFGFLPKTRLSVAVDWYDIRVKGEVTQLGASAILQQCYNSADFPNPYCSLFSRAGTGAPDPAQITNINDKYINIADQETKGIDVTGLVTHNMGHLGKLNFLANMSWTLKQSFALFPGQTESLLGVIDIDNQSRTGTRRWVGDFRLTWNVPGGWSLFWGTEIYSGASNNKEFEDANGGSLCRDSVNTDINGDPTGIPIRGHYCVDVTVPTAWYHNASVTKDLPNNLELTLGLRNVFNKKPPRVSLVGGTGIPGTIGPVVATSQYDFLGRRVFLSLSKKF